MQPAVDLLLTGNVGEEGLGNLRGVRAVAGGDALAPGDALELLRLKPPC